APPRARSALLVFSAHPPRSRSAIRDSTGRILRAGSALLGPRIAPLAAGGSIRISSAPVRISSAPLRAPTARVTRPGAGLSRAEDFVRIFWGSRGNGSVKGLDDPLRAAVARVEAPDTSAAGETGGTRTDPWGQKGTSHGSARQAQQSREGPPRDEAGRPAGARWRQDAHLRWEGL